MRADMQAEWWRASQADQYNLKDKLMRVGCRPLKRKYLACKATMGGAGSQHTAQSYGECQKIRFEMD